MPPKAKFTREQIIKAAVDVTREQGISAVTAREVGKQLGTSSTPVFVAFESMSDLKQEVYNSVKNDFYHFLCLGLEQTPAFKGFGIRMIEYAREYPNLFAAVHMNFTADNINYDDMTTNMMGADECVEAIKRQTGFSDEDAVRMFRQVLISGFGICYLVSSKTCEFTQQQLDEYLGVAYAGSLMAIKKGNMQQYHIHPSREETNDRKTEE